MPKSPGRIVPVILSGGSGTRLWPLSRKALPKQLLALNGERTMIQQTAARARGEGFAAPLVISGQDHRFLIAEQLRAAGIKDARIVLEPVGRNTAPAATVAALLVADGDPDGLVLLMPSDHVILDEPAFHRAVAVARQAALAGALVTFGIEPEAPETGYGYIKGADAMAEAPGALKIERFVEKPDRATAEAYLVAGGYFWNSGMFLFRAQSFLDEMARLQPHMLDCCRAALEHAHRDMDFIRLGEAAFVACPSDSIDYAVMEKAARAAVVPVSMGWNDVGSWRSLWDIAQRTGEGNAIQGDVLTERTRNCYLRSEGPMLATVGIEDMVVVATKDAVLISHRDATQDVKKVVDLLGSRGSDRHILHPVVHRPWGTYESIDSGANFQVKHIMVKPGQKLSLQMHHHRAEHWIVVEGTALVTCDDRQFLLQPNQSTFIPLGARHRLENPGKTPLRLIEVQSGSYLGEDDIVRFEDTYGRVPEEKKPA
ncbi:MAG: mannose-1-phosphate guanylyltransferase/mannose-6-phosphate isomerase [Alphaproteobacteria bacterium 64-11]|nr:mannose-1-phosphate guanylyltransferase/mannose-6-phosphate isomerase [Alphaproteobacteria bacterium]OJU13054.1 MAG: mannose-1-phosphate guanylyltransferase/mannose-6-phosphate isomerase [Alphaproteobacteria bacterium 64-11]